MAYRVPPHAAHDYVMRPPQRRSDRTLTRNAAIAAVTLTSITVIAAGSLMLGGRDFTPPESHAPGHRFQVALVAPTAPKVAHRNPLVALKTPGPHIRVAAVPLPRVRPADVATLVEPQPITLASLPLQPGRIEDDITGSLGDLVHDKAGQTDKHDEIARRSIARQSIAREVAHDIPLPSPRTDRRVAAVKPSHPLTAYEKLYGPVRVAALSYAATGKEDDEGLPRAPFDMQTAVYVISSHKVYLPDGTVLEAHSGLRDKIDDPRFVNVRMWGATPPHMYDLTLRESLFHGVEAIRLNPVGGEQEIFGRAGLLAHPFMMGPSGQSNGCVSFRDYDTFLEAYKSGKISRLAVIAKLD